MEPKKFIYLQSPYGSNVKYEVMKESHTGWYVCTRPGDRWVHLPWLYNEGYSFMKLAMSQW